MVKIVVRTKDFLNRTKTNRLFMPHKHSPVVEVDLVTLRRVLPKGTPVPLNALFMQADTNPTRNLRYAAKHDGIYASLDLIPNWFVKGDLTFGRGSAPSEIARVKKFHLLIRDLASRYLGRRDLDGIGWFLTQESSSSGKHHHFHFAITSDGIDLTRTSAAIVCEFLRKQWCKIADASQAVIEPWDDSQRERGIWYLTQYSDVSLSQSHYFGGADSHWRMSRLLQSKILERNTKGKP